MEQITIQIKDRTKAKLLLDLLNALDFVSSVATKHHDENTENIASTGEKDFFAVAGLWKNREVSIDSIRRNAWPRQER
ncbi:hypothetical protein WDW89_03310 [Deltaproteobacteria bacterium TL4]